MTNLKANMVTVGKLLTAVAFVVACIGVLLTWFDVKLMVAASLLGTSYCMFWQVDARERMHNIERAQYNLRRDVVEITQWPNRK